MAIFLTSQRRVSNVATAPIGLSRKRPVSPHKRFYNKREKNIRMKKKILEIQSNRREIVRFPGGK